MQCTHDEAPTLAEFDPDCELDIGSPLPRRPPTEADLIVGDAGNGVYLVWVQTAHFANGFAAGPVALAELDGQQVLVRAIGQLLAPSSDPRLELVGDWLVVRANRCESNDQCQAAIELLVRRGQAFVNLTLDSDDSCAAPAVFTTQVSAKIKLGKGSRVDMTEDSREFRLERELRFSSRGMAIIHEHLSVFDFDSTATGASALPRLVREASRDRPLTVEGTRLRVPPSLWTEVVSEDLIEFEVDVSLTLDRRATKPGREEQASGHQNHCGEVLALNQALI